MDEEHKVALGLVGRIEEREAHWKKRLDDVYAATVCVWVWVAVRVCV